MMVNRTRRKKALSIVYCCVWPIISSIPSLGCMNADGTTPIKSKFRFPAYFENTPAAVQRTLDDAIFNATASLSDIMSLDHEDTEFQGNYRNLTFDGTLGALDRLYFELHFHGNRLSLLSHTSDIEKVRESSRKAVNSMDKWERENIDLNPALYGTIAAFADTTDEAANLTGERKRLLTETLAGYERRGMALSDSDRVLLQSWQDSLTELTSNISFNINNDVGEVSFTRQELAGLTERQLEALRYDNVTDTYAALTAIYSQYKIINQYATSEATRLEALRVRSQRAMEVNGEPMLEVVKTRRDTAHLLGFDHWADYKTADKMAGSGAEAYAFIKNIDKRIDASFLLEKTILLDLKREHVGDPSLGMDDLNREDVGFYVNRLMEEKYQINEAEISEYFEEEATLRGIFRLYEELFNIVIDYSSDGPPGGAAWAEDIQFVYIYEASSGDDSDGGKKEKRPLGGVYLDLHPREGKFQHFAKFSIVKGHRRQSDNISADGSIEMDTYYQAPLCAIVGNWPVPVGDTPYSLWTFDNVNTMFHEFGHALHEVLTCAEFSTLAGTAVARDFVEVPSQMLERWLEDANVLRRFARHHETGEVMPNRLINSLLEAKYATVGHSYKRQVSYGFSDLRIHMYVEADDVPPTAADLYSATNEDYARYYDVPGNDTALLASFLHLFGGYDAGYYGYAWSDAIAADLASRFRESPDGFMDARLGALFRSEILEPGNSRDPNDLIHAFLGRDWNTNAFFDEMGLEEEEDILGKEDRQVDLSSDAESSAKPITRSLLGCIVAVIALSAW